MLQEVLRTLEYSYLAAGVVALLYLRYPLQEYKLPGDRNQKREKYPDLINCPNFFARKK
jgi:hypothetical protein